MVEKMLVEVGNLENVVVQKHRNRAYKRRLEKLDLQQKQKARRQTSLCSHSEAMAGTEKLGSEASTHEKCVFESGYTDPQCKRQRPIALSWHYILWSRQVGHLPVRSSLVKRSEICLAEEGRWLVLLLT